MSEGASGSTSDTVKIPSSGGVDPENEDWQTLDEVWVCPWCQAKRITVANIRIHKSHCDYVQKVWRS